MAYFDLTRPKDIKINMTAVPRWIIEIPNHLKTSEICIEAVRIGLLSLVYV